MLNLIIMKKISVKFSKKIYRYVKSRRRLTVMLNLIIIKKSHQYKIQ